MLTSRQMERLTFLIHYILRTIIIIYAIQCIINDITLHLPTILTISHLLDCRVHRDRVEN
jgi:hypothetical protein